MCIKERERRKKKKKKKRLTNNNQEIHLINDHFSWEFVLRQHDLFTLDFVSRLYIWVTCSHDLAFDFCRSHVDDWTNQYMLMTKYSNDLEQNVVYCLQIFKNLHLPFSWLIINGKFKNSQNSTFP